MLQVEGVLLWLLVVSFTFWFLFIGAPPPSPFSFFYSTLLIYYYLPIKKGVVLDFVHIYINLQKNRKLPTEEGSKISGAGNFIKINFGLKIFLGCYSRYFYHLPLKNIEK